MDHIVTTLAPIFILIALGATLSKTRFLSTEVVDGLTRLAYWVGLPCVLFYKVASAHYDCSTAAKVYGVFFIGFVASMFIAYLVTRGWHMPSQIAGTFIHGSFHGNLSFIGFAVILFHLAHSGLSQERIATLEGLAAITMVLGIITHNAIAVTVLLISQHHFGFRSLQPIGKGLITNPLIVASLLGLLYSAIFSSIPPILTVSLKAIGQLALPAALLGIGATLIQSKITANLTRAITASVIKVAIAPLCGAMVIPIFGLQKDHAMIAMVLLACPTAVAAFVVSSRLGGKPELTTAIIVISTLLSLASLSTVLALYAC